MSSQVQVAFNAMYSANIMLLVQQKGSRLKDAVRQEMVTGEIAYFDQIGAGSAIKRQSRHADTPLTETPHARRQVMLGCAGATVLGAILAPHAIATLWQWPLFFFWGSTAFGVFTLALAELGDRFTGAQLLAGSAAFALCWGFGGILGPPLSGTAMTAFGPEGLPIILGASFAFFTLVALWRAVRRPVSTPGPNRR